MSSKLRDVWRHPWRIPANNLSIPARDCLYAPDYCEPGRIIRDINGGALSHSRNRESTGFNTGRDAACPKEMLCQGVPGGCEDADAGPARSDLWQAVNQCAETLNPKKRNPAFTVSFRIGYLV